MILGHVTPNQISSNQQLGSSTAEEILKAAIKKQMEYYFSEENLMKDYFLRKKMDGEGYLPLSLVASFHRVQNMTQDLNLIIAAITDSKMIEIKDGVKVRERKSNNTC